LAVVLVLFSAPLGAQALADRLDPGQQSELRRAVVSGQLPPGAVWPRAVAPSGEITAASDWELTADGALRWGDAGYADETRWTFDDLVPMARWTLHAEQNGRWGMELHGDYYDEAPGWKATSLVLPREGNAFPLEARFLTKAFLWYNFDPLELEFGRQKVHFGPLDHSFLIADRIPFLDLIRARLAAGPWQLDWLISTPEQRLTGGGGRVIETTLLNVHRFSWRQETFALGVAEAYLVHRGANGPYVLGDFFPVGSLHQEDFSPNNVSILADAEWVPAPGWRLMAQGGFDEINGQIVGLPDDSTDTIWAWQTGAEWQTAVGADPVTVHTEAGMTHYLWGNFEEAAAKAVYHYTQFARTESIPLTSPYGPGATWWELRATWSPGALTLAPALALWTVKEGVSLELPYQPNHSLYGLGRWWNGRLAVAASWRLAAGWTLLLTPAVNTEGGQWSGELRLGIQASGSTDPRENG